MINTLLWLRRDLRLQNNPALDWALRHSDQLLLVYIHAPDEEAPWQPGGASRWWLHHSLAGLQKELANAQLVLHYFRGNSLSIIQQLISQHAITHICWNEVYEPIVHSRDQQILAALDNVIVQIFHDGLFFRPGSVFNQQQLPYRVYTPFSRKLKGELLSPDWTDADITQGLPNLKPTLIKPTNAVPLETLQILDQHPWHKRLHNYWTPGEKHAWQSLELFLDQSISSYKDNRDYPAVNGTSGLSAALHYGEISPAQILTCLRPFLDESRSSESSLMFLNQLIWREFAGHILWHYPDTMSKPMDQRYENNFWKSDPDALSQWQRGKTGIPIIDAGMKQLWQTGWMHNRVRMIVSSFLTKNLGLHWLDGARWFWDTLIDADIANNTMGWQWVAGCGVDAAPCFRVFNPYTQANRFDHDYAYIQRWLPQAIELDYPPPMVDIDTTRKQALQHYRSQIASR